MPYLLLPTARIHYQVEGSGPPIVFVHAGIADSRMWEADCAALASRFTTIRYDVRSYGRSSDATGDFAHHEDLAALLDHLILPRAAVVGCSMGGGIALDFALAYPERTSALVTIASGPRGFEWPEEDEAANDYADEPLDRGDVAEAIERNLRLWVAGPSRSLDAVAPAVVAVVRQMLTDNLARPSVEPWRPAADAIDLLPELACPALFVVGLLDLPGMVLASRTMAEMVEGARLVEVAGAAHFVSLEQPAIVRDLIAGHVAAAQG